MSLLDDVRQLADLYPITKAGAQRFHDDSYCGRGQDCPHFALPRIVAALEAAERVANTDPMYTRYFCFSCGEMNGPLDDGHHEDCLWQALVAALKDDGV